MVYLFYNSFTTYSLVSIWFVMITHSLFVISMYVYTQFKNKKLESKTINDVNIMLKNNYENLNYMQDIMSNQIHDFNKHLTTLRGLVDTGSTASNYINELLYTSYTKSNLCLSGNDVVDSIINYYISLADENEIHLSFNVRLKSRLELSVVDICSILFNQFDNALNACKKIENTTRRNIRIDIWQKGTFVFFKVTNSCLKITFDPRKNLINSKKYYKDGHGFGLKIIANIADKYNGIVNNEYKNGYFVSTVMLTNKKSEVNK